jgi:ketosteroid isomerase-like protein
VKEGALFTKTAPSAESKGVVEDFFTSLEKLDIESFMKVWADNGTQSMPLAPENFPSGLKGKEALYGQYKGLPQNYSSMQFPRKIFPTEDPNKVIVQYGGIIPLKDGGTYNNNYVGIFEMQEGKLQKFTEYFDPFILEKAFGKKLQNNFNVGTNK